MVTDYPLMNISSRVGHADIIKYPMAGMASHHVTLGVYNINTDEIIYLNKLYSLNRFPKIYLASDNKQQVDSSHKR